MSRIGTDELRDAVLDDGSFISWDTTPLAVPTDESYARELADARAATGRDESVLTGEGRVFGRRVAVVVCEFGFLGGSIGVAAADRITARSSGRPRSGCRCWRRRVPGAPVCRRARSRFCRW